MQATTVLCGGLFFSKEHQKIFWNWYFNMVTAFSPLITHLNFCLKFRPAAQAYVICLLLSVHASGNRFSIEQIRKLSLFMVGDTKQNNL